MFTNYPYLNSPTNLLSGSLVTIFGFEAISIFISGLLITLSWRQGLYLFIIGFWRRNRLLVSIQDRSHSFTVILFSSIRNHCSPPIFYGRLWYFIVFCEVWHLLDFCSFSCIRSRHLVITRFFSSFFGPVCPLAQLIGKILKVPYSLFIIFPVLTSNFNNDIVNYYFPTQSRPSSAAKLQFILQSIH